MNYADRARNGERQSLKPFQYKPGSAHRFAKLSEDDVRSIRFLDRYMSQRAIAKKFDVTQGHVSDIVKLKRWKEVT